MNEGFRLRLWEPPMSVLGHKQTFEWRFGMSALPLEADILRGNVDVR
jgi:hypothetical protein